MRTRARSSVARRSPSKRTSWLWPALTTARRDGAEARPRRAAHVSWLVLCCVPGRRGRTAEAAQPCELVEVGELVVRDVELGDVDGVLEAVERAQAVVAEVEPHQVDAHAEILQR